MHRLNSTQVATSNEARSDSDTLMSLASDFVKFDLEQNPDFLAGVSFTSVHMQIIGEKQFKPETTLRDVRQLTLVGALRDGTVLLFFIQ